MASVAGRRKFLGLLAGSNAIIQETYPRYFLCLLRVGYDCNTKQHYKQDW
jgi:hypothetical protein